MTLFTLVSLIIVALAFSVFVFLGLLVPAESGQTGSAASEEAPRLKARVFCAGPLASPRWHSFDGYADCRAAALVQGGDRACTWGCLGYGSCVEACPEGAISLDQKGLPHIDGRCTGCGICVAVCPRGVIRLVDRRADYLVACSSRDVPAERTALCAHPCTLCGVCAAVNSSGGYRMVRGMSTASIDYSRSGDRKAALGACPTGCIRSAEDPV